MMDESLSAPTIFNPCQAIYAGDVAGLTHYLNTGGNPAATNEVGQTLLIQALLAYRDFMSFIDDLDFSLGVCQEQ
jgi:hypothetical protein